METEDPILVLTTAGNRAEAATIAASLVDSGLVACVQIVNEIESVYRWEGAVARETEWLLLCKTTAGKYVEVEGAILAMHSYATPEVVAVRIERGSASYIEWLRRSVA